MNSSRTHHQGPPYKSETQRGFSLSSKHNPKVPQSRLFLSVDGRKWLCTSTEISRGCHISKRIHVDDVDDWANHSRRVLDTQKEPHTFMLNQGFRLIFKKWNAREIKQATKKEKGKEVNVFLLSSPNSVGINEVLSPVCSSVCETDCKLQGHYTALLRKGISVIQQQSCTQQM